MARLPAVIEPPPVLGMNTFDDPKALRPGEVVSLVNARPGNPPEPRGGMFHRLISNTDDTEIASNLVAVTTSGGGQWVVFWMQDGTDYKIVKVNIDTADMVVMGTATGLSSPHFHLINAYDRVYSVIDQDMTTWEGDSYQLRHKIVELDANDGELDTVREMCISESPEISSVALEAGGDWDSTGTDFMEYAWTYVRRDDEAAFGSDGYPITIATVLPGTVEGPEDSAYRENIEITGTGNKILINTLATDESRLKAVAQGATHIRVWRTRRQSTLVDAQGATKFFVSDVPADLSVSSIDGITLDNNPPKITTSSAHGFSDGDTVRIEGVVGTTELNGNEYTTEQTTATTFRLTGEDPSDYSRYTSGGVALRDAVQITGVTAPENTVTITTEQPHGVTYTGRPVVMQGLGGATELNNIVCQVSSIDSDTQLTIKNPGVTVSAYTSGGTLYPIGHLRPSVVRVTRSGEYVVVRVRTNQVIASDYYAGSSNPLVGGVGASCSFSGVEGATELNGDIAQITAVTPTRTVNRIGTWTDTNQQYRIVNYEDWTLDTLSSAVSAYTTGGSGMILFDGKAVGSMTATENPVTITTGAAHGFSTSETVAFGGIVGATELNSNEYTLTVVDDTSFTIPYGAGTTLSSYISGGYCSTTYGLVSDVLPSYPLLAVPGHGIDDEGTIGISGVLGATELNNNSYEVRTVDDDTFYIVTDSNDVSAYTGGGSIYYGGFVFDDTVTDAALAGETTQLSATNYAVAPVAGSAEYANSRLWLFGMTGANKGRAYYSEYAGGDSGTPTAQALANPLKFISWWSSSYYVDFAIKLSKYAIMPKRMGNDLYFFFDQETFVLYGASTSNSPTLLNDTIGLAFPNTLTTARIDIPGIARGECLLFLSSRGPAVIARGDEARLLSSLKIEELWPEKNGELWSDLEDNRDWIINHCSAEFWKDTWYVTYETYAGNTKTFGFYMNPALLEDPNAPKGAYEIEAEV